MVLGLLVLLVAPVVSARALSQPLQGSPAPTGVIVPLYFYPGASWNALIQQKNANPSVPFVAVVNPANGPGTYRDQNYATWINNLKAAGIIVIGYVYTEYTARSIGSVQADISAYKNLYGVQGVFFDQMSNIAGKEGYYSTLNSYSKSLGLSLTVGNPGTSVPSSYVGTMDCIITYENAGAPSISSIASSTQGYPKSNWAVVAYGIGSLDASYVSSASVYLGYIYLTNGVWPAPYSALSGYFAALVSTLNVGQRSASGSLTITALNAKNGSPINGLWTVIYASGNVVASGYTPMKYVGSSGATYVVSVSDYGAYTFNHWSTGSTSRSISVTMTQGTTLTAYYSVSGTP